MPATKLLIFGNPKGGTPVMLASPSSAIDLPLKILVWEDNQGKSLGLLQQPHLFGWAACIPAELVKNIAVVEALAEQAAA